MKDSSKTPQNETSSLPIKKPELEKLPKEEKYKHSVYVSLDIKKDNELKIHMSFDHPVRILECQDGQNFRSRLVSMGNSGIFTNLLEFFYVKDSKGQTEYSINYRIVDQGLTPFFTLRIYKSSKEDCPKSILSLSPEEWEDFLNNRESESTVYYGDADETKV